MNDVKQFIKRLEQLMTHYELSASALADKIKVQRSSISHLLKGRNKPSLEFIMKLNENFNELDLNWLLYGIGSFPNNEVDKPTAKRREKEEALVKKQHEVSKDKRIDKIVFFYKDGTFQSYHED